MMTKVISLLAILAVSSLAISAPNGYVFDNLTAYTEDYSVAKLKLRVYVDSNAQPEYWRLEEAVVKKALDKVAKKYSLEQMMGHKAKVQDELKTELDKLLADQKVTVTDLQIVTMSFTLNTDN